MSHGTMAEPTPAPNSSESAAALRAFFEIADAWKLSTDDQIKLLGSPGRSTFFKWKKETPALPSDTLERISHILNIYRALELLLPDSKSAEGWVRRPSSAPILHGRTALERMLSGQVSDLYVVRQYLDAQRGG
jgi:hypothetical protein